MSLKQNIFDEAKRIEEDAEYSKESHLTAATVWSTTHFWLGLPTAVLAVLSGGTALANLNRYGIFVGVSALLAGILAAISTFLNPKERASCHLTAGNSYLELRNNIRVFYTIDYLRETDDELVKRLKDLETRRNELNVSCVQPPAWAYWFAKRRIEKQKANQYAIDKRKQAKATPNN